MCNPGASKKGELLEVKEGAPTIYIGETSRSIYERSKEHWEGVRKKDPKNHMVKHQLMEHGGEPKPKFTMKVFKHYKTALGRQVAEAVRIWRRGGREPFSIPGGNLTDATSQDYKWRRRNQKEQLKAERQAGSRIGRF